MKMIKIPNPSAAHIKIQKLATRFGFKALFRRGYIRRTFNYDTGIHGKLTYVTWYKFNKGS